jgi:hypothetical protein
MALGAQSFYDVAGIGEPYAVPIIGPKRRFAGRSEGPVAIDPEGLTVRDHGFTVRNPG